MEETKALTPERLATLEKEGYDRQDPSGLWVLVFTLAIVVTLVVVVLGVDFLFQATLDQNVSRQVLTQEDQILQEVRTAEAEQLNHYRYLDKEKKTVRLTIDRAMELFAAESKAGKLFYPAKPAPVKTAEELAVAAPDGGAAPPKQ
ncbi:MAG: hypothetical protein SFV18_02980 [Bryobacteraceae bacterium]|nr:hypothetical protein [Bryobacteraceae bacterium]